VLGDEIDAILAGLNLEGHIAEASAAPKFRKQRMVAQLGLWSRAWLARLQALHAAECGNYGPAIALVRVAADLQAAELLIEESDAAEWSEWLAEPAIAIAAEEHATLFRLHPFRAAEVLARHPRLAAVYRAASDCSMPHFGATLLLAASDSTPERVLMTFGDRDFHLGLAEVVFGWLLELTEIKAEQLLGSASPYSVTDPNALRGARERSSRLLDKRDRCRVTTLDDSPYRYAVENWRRAPGAATKRIVL
jgi:hypothetical protein